MKEEIVKILESYVIDKVGETRSFIDPDHIETIADEIQKVIIKKI